MDPFSSFEAKFGKQTRASDDIFENFASRFEFARLQPSKTQKAGGLNKLNKQQLATLGYKPEDIPDYFETPERKEEKQKQSFVSGLERLAPLTSKAYQEQLSKTIKTPEFQQQYAQQKPPPTLKEDVVNFLRNLQSPDTARSQAVQRVATSPEYRQKAISAVPEFFSGFNVGLANLGREAVKFGVRPQEFEFLGKTPEERATKINKRFFPEDVSKLYPNIKQNTQAAKFGKGFGQFGAEATKQAGLLLGTGYLGNAISGATQATPLFTKAATVAPNIATYGTKAINFGTQGATYSLLNDLYKGTDIGVAGKEAFKQGAIQGILGPIETFIPDVGSTKILKAIPRAFTSATTNALTAKLIGADPWSAAILGAVLTGKPDTLTKYKYKWETGNISEAQFNQRMRELNPYLSPDNKQRIQDAFDSLSTKEKVFITTNKGITSEIKRSLPVDELIQVPTWYGKFANYITDRVAKNKRVSAEAANFATDIFLNPDKYSPVAKEIAPPIVRGAEPMTTAPTTARPASTMTAVGKDYNQPLPGQINPQDVETLWETKYADKAMQLEQNSIDLNNQLKTAKGKTKQEIQNQIADVNMQSAKLEEDFLAEARAMQAPAEMPAPTAPVQTERMAPKPEAIVPKGFNAQAIEKPVKYNFGAGDIQARAVAVVDEKLYKETYGKTGGVLSFTLEGPGVNSETGFKSVAGVSYEGKLTPARLKKMMNDIVIENARVTEKPAKPEPKAPKGDTPETVKVFIKSKFRDGGGYVDLPVIRKVENKTLYQGGSADGRQFWTENKDYAAQFGKVTKKTGTFYEVDNGNRMTTVYVDANQANKPTQPSKPKPLIGQELTLTRVKDEAIKKIQAAKTFTDIQKLHDEYQNALSKSISDTASEAMWNKFNSLQKEIADAEVFAKQKLLDKYPVLRETKNLSKSNAERDALIKAKPKPIKTKVAKPKQVISAKPQGKPKIIKGKPLTEKNIISAVKSVIPRTKTLPVLNMIAYDGNQIISSDLDNYLTVKTDKKYKPIAVDAKVVQSRGLDEAHKIGMENLDKQNNISTTKEDFPEAPKNKYKDLGTIDAKDMVLPVKTVMSHLSADLSRPALNSILLKSIDGELRIYGTDSYTASVNVIGKTNIPEGEYMLPSSSVKIINNILDLNPTAKLKLGYDAQAGVMSIEAGNFNLQAQMTSGVYPNIDSLLKDDKFKNVNGYQFNIKDMLDTLKDAQLKGNTLNIIPSANSWKLTYMDKTGLEVNKTIPVKKVKNQTFGVTSQMIMPKRPDKYTEGLDIDPAYLIKTLKNVQDTVVNFNYSDKTNLEPIFVQSPNVKPYKPTDNWAVSAKDGPLPIKSYNYYNEYQPKTQSFDPGRITDEEFDKSKMVTVPKHIVDWASNLIGADKAPIVFNQIDRFMIKESAPAYWWNGFTNFADMTTPFTVTHEIGGHHIDQLLLTPKERDELDRLLELEVLTPNIINTDEKYANLSKDEKKEAYQDNVNMRKEARATALARRLIETERGYKTDFKKQSKLLKFLNMIISRIKLLFSRRSPFMKEHLDNYIDYVTNKARFKKLNLPKDKWIKTPEEAEQRYIESLKKSGDMNLAVKNADGIYSGITTNILNEIKSKEIVSKEFIMNLSNRPQVKMAERLIIQKVLRDLPTGQKVNVTEFSNAVKAELLPLNEIVISDEKAYKYQIEADTLSGEIKKATGLSPNVVGYKHHVGNEKFDKAIINKVDRWNELQNKMEKMQFSQEEITQYNTYVLDHAVRGDVQNYAERIYESPYQTPRASSVHFPNDTKRYFAHTRIEELPGGSNILGNAEIKYVSGEYVLEQNGKIIQKSKNRDDLVPKFQEITYGSQDTAQRNKLRRVLEVQSDLFQKGRFEDEFRLNKIKVNSLESMNNLEVTNRLAQQDDDLAVEYNNLVKEIWPEVSSYIYEEKQNAWNEDIPKENLQGMTIQEWLKYIKDNGSKFTFTDKKVKRMVELQQLAADITEKNANDLKLTPYKNTWYERIIREEIRKAGKENIAKLAFPTGATAMKIEHLVNNTGTWRLATYKDGVEYAGQYLEDMGFDIQKGDVITDDGYTYIVVEPKVDLPNDIIKFVGIASPEMNILNNSELYSYAIEKGYLKEIDGDQQVDLSKVAKDEYMLSKFETETFNIGEMDVDDPIYKFYQKDIQKFLKKIRPDLETVVDENGITWYETQITEADAEDVIAFQRMQPQEEMPEQEGRKAPQFPKQGIPERLRQELNLPTAKDISKQIPPTDLGSANYNIDHINIDSVAKDNLSQAIDEMKPQLEEVIGRKLSNDEVINIANNTNTILTTAATREKSSYKIAANLKLRERIAQAAAEGRVDAQFVKDVLTDKAAGADIARQLQARRIDADPKEATLIDILLDGIYKSGADNDAVVAAAKKYNLEDPEDQIRFYREFVKPRFEDWLDKLRYNSMLSSPNTHVVNTSSNWQGTGIITPIEKLYAGGLDWMRSTITKGERTQFAGEAGAFLKGYYSNLRNATRALTNVLQGKSAITNKDIRLLPLTTKEQKVKRKIERTLDFPMRLLEGMDQFFSTMTSAGVEQSLLYRERKGVKVPLSKLKAKNEAEFRLFRGELEVKDEGTLLNAIGYLANRVNTLRKSKNPIVRITAKFTFPFLVTPTNIVKQAVQFTPAGVAALPGQENKTRATARILIGATFAALAGLLLGSSRMTWAEPTEEKKKKAFRAAGLQPYSVKIGDKWYSFNKLHPAIAFNLAMMASIYDAQKKGKMSDTQAETALTGLAQWAQFFFDQSYVKNMGDFIAATKGDIDKPTQLIGNYLQQNIPFKGFLGWVQKLTDDIQRQPNPDANIFAKQLQYTAAQLPWLSKQVPARTGPTGEPIKNTNTLLNAFTPGKVSTENADFKQFSDVITVISTLERTKVNDNINKAIENNNIDEAKKLGEDFNNRLEDKLSTIKNEYGDLSEMAQDEVDKAKFNLSTRSIKSRQNSIEEKTGKDLIEIPSESRRRRSSGGNRGRPKRLSARAGRTRLPKIKTSSIAIRRAKSGLPKPRGKLA